MLSYVIPEQEITTSDGHPMSDNAAALQVPCPPRNLSLRLNSYAVSGDEIDSQHMQTDLRQQPNAVDVLLANTTESCDERTHLLLKDEGIDTLPLHVKRQNSNSSNNNNSFSLNNNANCSNYNSCNAVDGRDDVINVNISREKGNEVTETTISDDAITINEMSATVLDSDISDRQSLHQNVSNYPRPTKKQKLSKLGSNKTVGLKRFVNIFKKFRARDNNLWYFYKLV